jgi:hypothetical protein
MPSGSDSDGSEDFSDGSEVSDSDDGMASDASSGDDDDGEGYYIPHPLTHSITL